MGRDPDPETFCAKKACSYQYISHRYQQWLSFVAGVPTRLMTNMNRSYYSQSPDRNSIHMLSLVLDALHAAAKASATGMLPAVYTTGNGRPDPLRAIPRHALGTESVPCYISLRQLFINGPISNNKTCRNEIYIHCNNQ